MFSLLFTAHLISFAIAFGGRAMFIPLLKKRMQEGVNERLDELEDVLSLSKWSDYGLIVAFASGLIMFFISGVTLMESHWAFKLKLVTLALLIIDIGAFHVAKMRIVNHYDSQMIPAIQRLNTLAVTLLICIIFFTSMAH